MEKEKVLETLNALLERELAGLVRYTHYSFMIFGHTRIPIIGWLRGLARESLDHAELIGEHITSLGGHPSLKIASLLETHKHSINDILQESIEHEKEQVTLFHELLRLVQGQNIALEEFARTLISDEEIHISEVEKMLRQPK
ncbi:MAG TPA: ferritin-like domain-containing protein [Blastocatellia bacterium]|nr:ferritin-like domain-containing protein [Blastocatellia bacterium]